MTQKDLVKHCTEYIKRLGRGRFTVNPKELAMGIKEEAEHTHDLDLTEKEKIIVQTKIALDHLVTENPRYYSILKKAGL